MAVASDVDIYKRLRKPRDAGLGWYKAFAGGIQKHYHCDYLEVANYKHIMIVHAS